MIKAGNRAVIFDLDGTLLDTSPGSIDSVNYTIKNLGLKSLGSEELYSFVGPPIQESFRNHFNMDESAALNAAGLFRRYYKEHSLFMADEYPGVMDLLAALKSRNYAIAVATYKREDYAMSLLEHFGIAQYCDSIHGADDACVRTKTDIVAMCMQDLSASPNESIMIGDSEHDAQGAEKLGIRFIGVGYGFGFKSLADISKFRHIGYVHAVSELLPIITQIGN